MVMVTELVQWGRERDQTSFIFRFEIRKTGKICFMGLNGTMRTELNRRTNLKTI